MLRRRWTGSIRGLPCVCATLALLAGCGHEGRIDVVAAASLRVPLQELAARFEAEHPGARVRLLTGGSTALARRVLELDLPADLVALADDSLFEELLIPRWTSFHVGFASDRLVLAYGERSAVARGPARGWEEVLGDPGISVAMADPDVAPVGYRTLLALRLYDMEHPGALLERRVVERVGQRHMRPDVAELLAPLQAGAVDVAFVYSSTAIAAALDYLPLPAEIDLGDPDRAAEYARASVEVAGRTQGTRVRRTGAPILYGVAVRPDAGADVARLLALLLGPEGRAALARHGLRPLEQPRWRGDVPVGLAGPAGQ